MNHENKFLSDKTLLLGVYQDYKQLKRLKRLEDNELKLLDLEIEQFKRDKLAEWMNATPNWLEISDQLDHGEPLPYELTKEYCDKIAQYNKQRDDILNHSFASEMFWDISNTKVGKACERIGLNEYHRFKKYRKRCEYLFNMKRRLFFLTFTFSNESFARFTENALKRRVLAWLRDNCEYFIANKDFGSENARFHMHALVIAKNDFIDVSSWPLGFFFAKVCGKRYKDRLAIEQYIIKLSRHAIKETTKDNRICYCRLFAENGI